MDTYILVFFLILTYISILIYALNRKCYDFKMIVIRDSKNAEAMLRWFLLKHQNCEIVVIDKTKKEETHAILEKIACDVSRVHIIHIQQ